MGPQRITIRNVDPELWSLLRAVAADNEMTLGEALSDAIETWYESLDEFEDAAQSYLADF